jgi:hypothetical protein
VCSGNADLRGQGFLTNWRRPRRSATIGVNPACLFCANRVQDFLTRDSGCRTPVFQRALTAPESRLPDDGASQRKPGQAVMITYLSEREYVVEQIDAICLRLFDAWCESRNVTPLAYLMHCWPMINSTPHAVRRLGETMRDLRRYHADHLDDDDFQTLCEMADLIDELIERPARTVRLPAEGEGAR